MLEMMRKKHISIIGYFVFAIVILAFVISFGPGSFRKAQMAGAGHEDAGTVNGEPISKSQFDSLFAREYEQRRRYDKDISQDEETEIRQQAFDRLVASTLWLQEADRMGYTVSDEYLGKEIRENRMFQEDGAFSSQLYHRYVHYGFNTTVKKYEEELRREIAARFLQQSLSDTAYITHAEAWELYQQDKDKVDLAFIQIPASKAPSLGFAYAPADDEISAYLVKNASAVDEQLTIDAERYAKKERVVASQLLWTLPPEADEASVASVKAKAQADAAKLTADAFETAALTLTGVDRSKLTPREIEKGSQPGAWDEAVFSLEAGAISAPIQLPEGFVVVYVKEKHAATQADPKDETLRRSVARELMQKEALTAFLTAKASEYQAKLAAGQTINQIIPYEDAAGQTIPAAAEQVIVSGRTHAFARNAAGYIRGIGVAADIMAAAFAMTEANMVAGPFTVNGDVYLVQLIEHTKAERSAFDVDRSSYVQTKRWPLSGAQTEGYSAWMKTQAEVEASYAASK